MIEQQPQLPVKNLLNTVASALGIRPGEGLPFSLLFGQAFFMGAALITFYTAANALFLVEFGASYMPYVYVVSAIATTTVGITFTQLERRISLPFVLIGTVGFLLASILSLWLGLRLTDANWLVFIVMAWLRLIWTIANLVLWVLTGRLFNVRQGKRLFSLVMAAPVMAIILIGFFTSILINNFNVVDLLLFAGGGLLVTMVLLLITVAKYWQTLTGSTTNQEIKTVKSERQGTSFRELLQNRFVLLFFIYAIFSTVGTYVLDFAFVTEAGANYTDGEELGQFFGTFLATGTLLMLFLSVLSGRLFNRFGLKVGIILNPLLVGFGALVAVFSGALGSVLGSLSLVFLFVVGTKLADDVMVVVNNAGRNLLYQPLRDDQRIPVQTAVESVIAPVFSGLTGVFLALLSTFGNLSTMSALYIFLVIVVIWFGVGILLDREYGVALKNALTKRRLGGEAEPLIMDKSGTALLQERLNSPHPGIVIYTLNMLAESDPETLSKHLPALLDHPAPEVRQSVLERIGKLRLTAVLDNVKQRISVEPEAAVRGEALQAFVALGRTEVCNDVSVYLDDPNPPVRLGALIGLIRHGGIMGTLLAGQKLLNMVDSTDTAERVMAAQTLGEVGISSFYQPLLKLLNDEDIQVQQTALIAAGSLKSPDLWPLVIDKLETAQTSSAAVSALVAGGVSVLPELEKRFIQSQHTSLLIQLAQVFARIRGHQAVVSLQHHLNFPDQALRSYVLYALSRCGYQAQGDEVARIEQQIKNEVTYAAWILGILLSLSSDNEADASLLFLQAALQHRVSQAQTRIFYLLSFIYDSQAILRARDIFQLSAASATEKAYALELLDILLSQSLKEQFFPLLDEASPKTQLQKLGEGYSQPNLNLKQALQTLLTDSTGRVDNWLNVCVLYSIGKLGQGSLSEAIIPFLSSSDTLVRETALLALSQLQADKLDYLDKVQNDSDPQVRRLLKHLKNKDTGKATMLSTIERILFLKGVDLFEQVSGEELIQVAQVAQEVTFAPQETFIKQGDVGDCLYIIIHGEAQIVVENVAEVATLGEKSVIGEMAILDNTLRTASAVATTEISALKIVREDFQELITEKPDLAAGIIRVLVRRLEKVSRKVAH